MALQVAAVLCLLVASGGASAEVGAVSPLRVDGLVAATFTPFHADGSLNADAVESQAAWLNATGVRWVFVSGTTGESLKLTLAERKAQTATWMSVAAKYGIQCIIHVGAEAIGDAIVLAAQAQELGAAAIGAMPPVFFKPATPDALAATMAPVAAAAGKLPMYYYHIPSMTGVAFPDGLFPFVQAMEARNVTNFAGIKYTGLYTHPGFTDATRIAAYKGGKYEVLCGRDEMMVEALAVGFTGFVGSQYNFAGDL